MNWVEVMVPDYWYDLSDEEPGSKGIRFRVVYCKLPHPFVPALYPSEAASPPEAGRQDGVNL